MSIKNNKGFSLIEVLVAVAIIGIISGIAVPQFLKQRENAARVAADTSAGNIAKAFQQCRVLKSFGECDELDKLDINCPSGSDCEDGKNDPKFCAHITRGETTTLPSGEFSVCVAMSGTSESRTYGGTLITGKHKICKIKQPNDCTTSSLRGAVSNGPSIKICTKPADCNNHGAKCAAPSSSSTNPSRTCDEVSSTGKCNSNGDCV